MRIRIRIQQLKLMRIHADPDPDTDPDPKPWIEDIRKLSFAVRAVEKWNRLPDWVRIEEKPDSFKIQLKKALE
jgi:hypothetical protein